MLYLKFNFRFITLAAFVVADEKRVPPRTPLQRMTTLKRFADSWINANIGLAENRPARADQMTTRVQMMTDKLTLQYGKCGFFDPNVPNGGPKPSRKRRSDDIDVFDDFEDSHQDGTKTATDIRLSADEKTAWKQIGTGYKKWIYRYMAGCNGEKVYNYHSERLNKVIIRLHVRLLINLIYLRFITMLTPHGHNFQMLNKKH